MGKKIGALFRRAKGLTGTRAYVKGSIYAMSNIAIKVENLSKQCRIGELHQGYYKTQGESVMSASPQRKPC